MAKTSSMKLLVALAFLAVMALGAAAEAGEKRWLYSFKVTKRFACTEAKAAPFTAALNAAFLRALAKPAPPIAQEALSARILDCSCTGSEAKKSLSCEVDVVLAIAGKVPDGKAAFLAKASKVRSALRRTALQPYGARLLAVDAE